MKIFFAGIGVLAMAVVSYGQVLYFVDDVDNSLKTIDVSTLDVSAVGSLGTIGNFGDLAFDFANGVMYYVGGRNDNNLYSVDLLTGAATLIGSHGIDDVFALGWDPVSGNLYAKAAPAGTDTVAVLSKSTGAATVIGSNSAYPSSMTYNSITGQMVLITAGSGYFYSLDLTDGSTSLLFEGDFVDDGGLAFVASQNTYYHLDWSGDFYAYDAAFNRTLLGNGFGSVSSLEAVPEPATMTVLGLGALVALRRKKKASA